MQFYRGCKLICRKALSPVTIIFIPFGKACKTIHFNISPVSITLLTVMFFANLIFLCCMIPYISDYHDMKRQFLDHSRKASDLKSALLSVEKANKDLHALVSQAKREGKIYREKRFVFNIKVADMGKYNRIISDASIKYNVEAALIKAIIKMESNFDHLAVSPHGAEGLMQLMPQTAQAYEIEDTFHPENNIEGGTRYIRYLLDIFEENLPLALAAYNVGESTVIRYHHKVPPYKETQEYVKGVLNHLYSYRRIEQKIKNGKVISYNASLFQQQEATAAGISGTIARE